jgi:hypothetical protein
MAINSQSCVVELHPKAWFTEIGHKTGTSVVVTAKDSCGRYRIRVCPILLETLADRERDRSGTLALVARLAQRNEEG